MEHLLSVIHTTKTIHHHHHHHHHQIHTTLRLCKILKSIWINEYQNARENCVFLQCGPCRGHAYVTISKDIRSGSSQMDYHIVKTFSKFTGMHLNWIFLKKLKLHLMKKILQHILLSVRFVKFLGTPLLLKTSCELFFKKWRTNLLIIIKRCRKVNSSFKKRNHLRKLTANLKLDSVTFKKIFASMIALQKWWKMLFISS